MRSTFAVPLAVLLLGSYMPNAALSQQDLDPKCKPQSPRSGLVVTNASKTLSLTDGIYHCVDQRLEDEGKNLKKYPVCWRHPIPVIVLEREDPNVKPECPCLTLMPYKKLVVHGKAKANGKTTTIKWELHGPANYEFADDGVFIRDVDPDFFTGNTKDGPRKYKWLLKDQDAYKIFDHFAMVRDPTGKICEPIDPDITNTSN